MKHLLKASVFFLFATKAFALTTMSLDQLKQDITDTRISVSRDCSQFSNDDLNKMKFNSNKSCYKDISKLRRALCYKKIEFVSNLENIVSNKNIDIVSKRFSTTPAEDALGGVLIWQMKNSINDINSSWANYVDKVTQRTKCRQIKDNKLNIKAEVMDPTNDYKNYLENLTLTVNSK